MSNTGAIKMIDPSRGFAFIRVEDGEDVFFHKSQAMNWDAMATGDRVVFETRMSPRTKKIEGVGVRLAG